MSEYIKKTSAIEAIKAIKYGLWEVDIPSPSCPEYVEHHEQITELMGICDKRIEMIQNMPSANEWIPVEDRLPEYGEVVLVCGVKGGVYTAMLKKEYWYGWWKMNARNHFCEPLAWMPLPEPFRRDDG